MIFVFVKATGISALTSAFCLVEQGDWTVLAAMAIPLGLMWSAIRQHATRRARERVRA